MNIGSISEQVRREGFAEITTGGDLGDHAPPSKRWR